MFSLHSLTGFDLLGGGGGETSPPNFSASPPPPPPPPKFTQLQFEIIIDHVCSYISEFITYHSHKCRQDECVKMVPEMYICLSVHVRISLRG